jgi:hypothetical protein
MRIRKSHYLMFLAFSACFVWAPYLLTQDQPIPQDNSAKQPSSKELKRRQKQLYKELGSPDRIWLDDEVVDIITPDERKAFLELSTNEEREQFIEIFWDKRNRDPESPINTAKEEHYRRLAYADEHFSFTRAEISAFAVHGLEEVLFDILPDVNEPDVRRFRVLFRLPQHSANKD